MIMGRPGLRRPLLLWVAVVTLMLMAKDAQGDEASNQANAREAAKFQEEIAKIAHENHARSSDGVAGHRDASMSGLTPLGRAAKFDHWVPFQVKLVPKTGSSFLTRLIKRCLIPTAETKGQPWRVTADTLPLRHVAKRFAFVAMTMRNPCDMYVSMAHYGGAQGFSARPYHPPYYGKGTQHGPNPVPNYPCIDDGEGCQFVADPLPIDKDYTADELVALRRNLPAGMLEKYISASRPKAHDVGWYSFYMWEMLVAPECMKATFLTRRGALKFNESGASGAELDKLRLQYAKCYANRHRVKKDLFKWEPKEAAHCWVFQETLMLDMRDCFVAYENSYPGLKGVVNWTEFDVLDKLKTAPLWDRSKSLAFAKERHGSCATYNPGLDKAVRKHDRILFDKFGYTTCCGPRSQPL